MRAARPLVATSAFCESEQTPDRSGNDARPPRAALIIKMPRAIALLAEFQGKYEWPVPPPVALGEFAAEGPGAGRGGPCASLRLAAYGPAREGRWWRFQRKYAGRVRVGACGPGGRMTAKHGVGYDVSGKVRCRA